jgi:hypothetical protein
MSSSSFLDMAPIIMPAIRRRPSAALTTGDVWWRFVQPLDARARRYREGAHLAVGRRPAHDVVAETDRLRVEVDDAVLPRRLIAAFALLVCHGFSLVLFTGNHGNQTR